MPVPGTRKAGWVEVGGILIPLAGHIQQLVLWLPLFSVPPGTSIRPMGTAAYTIINGMLTLLGGLILGGALFYRGRKLASALCVLFSLTPVPMAIVLVRVIAAWHHLELSS